MICPSPTPASPSGSALIHRCSSAWSEGFYDTTPSTSSVDTSFFHVDTPFFHGM